MAFVPFPPLCDKKEPKGSYIIVNIREEQETTQRRRKNHFKQPKPILERNNNNNSSDDDDTLIEGSYEVCERTERPKQKYGNPNNIFIQ